MANVNPVKYNRPFMMRVDDDFLAKLDDLRVAERPVKSRSDYIRKLVEEAEPPQRGDKRAARR